MVSEDQKRNIVIIGGGIIGCSSAYYITRHPAYNPALHKVTVLEATRIASGASGKAGGLLALWAYPANIVPLSYRLHAELAAEHGGEKRWGYRTIHAGSLSAKGRHSSTGRKSTVGPKEEWSKLPKLDSKAMGNLTAAGVPKDLDWFVPDTIKAYSEMGDPTNTAQVHPFLFTTSMAELAEEKGAIIQVGATVTAIDYTGNHVKSVTYEDKTTGKIHTIPATDVVVAAGPWASHVFPEAPIEAVRAHSVTIKANVTPYVIFSEISLPADFGRTDKSEKGWKSRHGNNVSPEIYARPNGEVYACGEPDSLIPLPKNSDLVQCDESHCQDIIDYVGSISDELRGEVLVKQACYLPSVSGADGPIIGPTGIKGLLLAAGHTCWGIQNSCATGKLISEFIFDGKAISARIDSLDPRRVL